MYKIGEFSKLSKMTVKTLRFYADTGILVPEYTDEFTGYRFYSPGQLKDAVRIQALKQMGFSLEEIREFKEDALCVIEKKQREITLQIEKLNRHLKQLEISKSLLDREDDRMFHVVMREQECMRVKAVRQIFGSRDELWEMLRKKKGAIVVNYENEWKETDLDLEVSFPDPQGEKELFAGVNIPGYKSSEEEKSGFQKVASLICVRETLDDAYAYLTRYLKEADEYQVIGEACERYVDKDTIELLFPIHKLHAETEEPCNDDISISFEDDPEVIGHWKTVKCCLPNSQDAFRPDRMNWQPLDGDITDLYFLPEGEKYWCFSWTKGYVISRFGVSDMRGLNPYQIRTIDGKKYMYLWFKDRNYFYRGALPDLLILEKMDSKKYKKEEIRIRDELTEEFEEDEIVAGRWKVCDFVRDPDLFREGEYNAGFPKDKMFFRRIDFRENGDCEVQYGEEILQTPDVNWSKGVIRDVKRGLSQKYERRVINGTEYLFAQFKSGDYFYNHQPPWYYVFTRETMQG